VTPPTALLTPTLDGEESSYFEWLCAGLLDVRSTAGAMHQIDRQPVLAQVRFGFDREYLYVRLDTQRSLGQLLDAGWTFSLAFLKPGGFRATITGPAASPVASFWTRDGSSWLPAGADGLRAAAGSILELAVPLASFRVAGLQELAFSLMVLDATGNEIERHPTGRPVELTVPDASFEARNWTA
jgi:hypothetical protein